MKTTIWIISALLILFSISLIGATRQSDQQYGVWLRVAQLDTLLADKDPAIVDIRTPMEFRTGHLAGAMNLPLQSLDRSVAKLDKNRPLLIYCNTVNRVAASLPIFKENGFETVYMLDGGYTALRESGYPLVR
ncbi:MAG: rhodanese-like domain-containing protein [Desulfopila sp.]